MTEWNEGRLLKSARALKSYFEQKWNTHIELLAQKPQDPSIQDIALSPYINNEGLWGVRVGRPLAEADMSEMKEMFNAILSGLERLRQRRSDLIQIQTQLEDIANFKHAANVIPMRRTSRPPRQTPTRRWPLRLDCLIESPYISEVYKMAHELHANSDRIAFVEYRDVVLSTSGLAELGAITLFIPSLHALSLAEQSLLVDCLRKPIQNRPLFMVGSMIPYSELRVHPEINGELLAILARAYIKLTKPFADYKDQRLIHYFLDSLSAHPT